MKKTTILKQGEVTRNWYIVDANGKTLGRLATRIATVIRGKNKACFVPFMDNGDFVIVVNASKIHVTGRKRESKTYWRYTGYPGGMRLTRTPLTRASVSLSASAVCPGTAKRSPPFDVRAARCPA